MELNDAWRRAFDEGVASDYGDHYLRAVFTFETGSATYGWLNSRLFIGEGRFPAAGTIEPHLRGRIAEPSNQHATAPCTRTIERAHAPHTDPEVPNHDDPGPRI